jgi:hypothetical protein
MLVDGECRPKSNSAVKTRTQVIRHEEHLFVQFQWTALSNIPHKNRVINDITQSSLLNADLLRP